jgi:selenocysteine lyase/cysteine desulfurase
MTDLEKYFEPFRHNIIGLDQTLPGPYGTNRIIYADWTASGRLYQPIEEILIRDIAPFVANTHTETSSTGCIMTHAYQNAKEIIKRHVNASSGDVLIASQSGMTGVVNKFQRILGLRIHEKYRDQVLLPEEERPVVFISHMEHHSNQTSWLETLADVEIIAPDDSGLMDLSDLDRLLEKYAGRKTKIAAITSCSNVTGIATPYHEVARKMHRQGGVCFVDFACSAPYIRIDMHPENADCSLDAIYFSPHKFLGGPGASGVLVFNADLYKNRIPDQPGGGTVDWTNPWGEHKYHDTIEEREDGGTPGFLQTIKVALCLQLKEKMSVEKILRREHEQLVLLWPILDSIRNLHVLANTHRHRLGVISFYIEGLHYNLAVRLLNDRYGIQTRGGCSCAGTYGHYLLNVTREVSQEITCKITHGDFSEKPGWVRLSIHPTMTNAEIVYIGESIKAVAENWEIWSADYSYDHSKNEFQHKLGYPSENAVAEGWFAQIKPAEYEVIF